ncbi:hypothetical protein ACWD0Z_04030 [Streptomyces sp. NPDC003007]
MRGRRRRSRRNRGLSLGGYFAARTTALEPRLAAVATVSGPFRLDWQ